MEFYNEVWIASAGESFDSVAFEFYGDEKYASELMTANPEYCGNMEFSGGERLILPVLDIPDDDAESYEPANAPWKED